MIRNIRLISKFIKSLPGSQTITIHILPKNSRSKSNERMKFNNRIKEIFFFKKYAENKTGRLVPELF